MTDDSFCTTDAYAQRSMALQTEKLQTLKLVQGHWLGSTMIDTFTLEPASGKMVDMGVLAISNPEYFDFSKGPGKNEDGSPRPTHGFHRIHLPSCASRIMDDRIKTA